MKSQGNAKTLLSGIGVGAALMYFLDPDRGARRRAMMRDQMIHALHAAEDAAGTTSRDLANRARGMLAAARGARAEPGTTPDDRVVEGAARIEDGDLQEQWTPAARLLGGLAGGMLTIYGARRRDSFGAAVGLAGLALLARGTANTPLARAATTGGKHRDIDLHKTINVAAPVEDVFAFLTDWESFPRWMTHVREVRASGARGDAGERTHWEVDGPAGTTVSWDAETTRFVPNELVAWRSLEGAPIRQLGRMRFGTNPDGSTRVHVQLSYRPPGGAIGDAVAALFARDPKRQMDDDLARLKSMIETGIPPRDAARPSRTPDSRVTSSRAPAADTPPTVAEAPGA